MAKVKALKSFEFEGQIKNPWDSEPFDIPESRVTQFLALGLVAVVDGGEQAVDSSGGQSPSATNASAEANALRRGRKPVPKTE